VFSTANELNNVEEQAAENFIFERTMILSRRVLEHIVPAILQARNRQFTGADDPRERLGIFLIHQGTQSMQQGILECWKHNHWRMHHQRFCFRR
jgi:hypothetical protein